MFTDASPGMRVGVKAGVIWSAVDQGGRHLARRVRRQPVRLRRHRRKRERGEQDERNGEAREQQ